MAKKYEKADVEVMGLIQHCLDSWHDDLVNADVRIGAQMVSTDGDGPAITKNGFGCSAYVRCLATDERLHIPFDALITLDAVVWEKMTEKERIALLDHEITHLVLKRKKNDQVKLHLDGRPIMGCRGHDFEVTGFASIIQRHRGHAIETKNVKFLTDTYGQFLLPWGIDKLPAGMTVRLAASGS